MYVERVATKQDACCMLFVWCLAISAIVYYLYLVAQLSDQDSAYLRGQSGELR